MNLKNQNVLMFARATAHGGTENVILQICKILKPLVNKIVVCTSEKFEKEHLVALEIRHIEIPDIEKKSLNVIHHVLQVIENLIREEKITVIHAHHRMAAFYTWLLSKKHNFQFVCTAHSTFFDKKVLTRIIYGHANLIACGEAVKENLVEFFGVPGKKVVVIHNAIEAFDGDIILVKELENFKKNGFFLVGNVGRLSYEKGMEYFISALPEIKKQHEKTKFVIIGDGEERTKLEELAKFLGIEEDVIFLGYRKDARNVMGQLDLLVLSSLWEGLPLSPIEAFSMGKTIIATDVSGTVEIVKDGVNGCVVETKSSQQIAKKIVYLIKNPDIKMRYEHQAKETFRTRFSFEKYADQIIRYYKSL